MGFLLEVQGLNILGLVLPHLDRKQLVPDLVIGLLLIVREEAVLELRGNRRADEGSLDCTLLEEDLPDIDLALVAGAEHELGDVLVASYVDVLPERTDIVFVCERRILLRDRD